MKKYIVMAACAVMSFTACVGDLDQFPMSDTTIDSGSIYSNPDYRMGQLAKIYGGFTLVGQSGAGTADIAVADAGASEYLRALWSLQSITTDEVKCIWGDGWVAEINRNTWTSTKNDAIYAAYSRGLMMISFANEYLRNTDDSNPEIAIERAEVRFLRAYAYWTLLDCFGNVPFTTPESPVGAYKPEQIKAKDLYYHIKSELEEITSENSALKEPHTQVYPRIDKGAAYGLLARLTINHKAYLGEEIMDEYDVTMAAAEKVIEAYDLATNFEALFMGDNGENPDALKEMVYTACYDAAKTQSYGGPSYLVLASKNDNSYGIQGGWAGLVIPHEFVAKVIGDQAAEDAQLGSELDYSVVDTRGRFHLRYSTNKEMSITDFPQGWHQCKFNNNRFLNPGVDYSLTESFASIDFPLIRAAEMNLLYAEASCRTGKNANKAVQYFNEVRNRAKQTPATALTLDDVFNEITKELAWEGHRRTTLIRYDLYTSATYLWPYKGGVKSGQGLEDYVKLFPLPIDDLQVNENLVQNPGY